MWSWQILLAPEYLLSLFIVEHIQLCKLSNTGLSIHISPNPTLGEESISSVVFGLCMDSVSTAADHQRTDCTTGRRLQEMI